MRVAEKKRLLSWCSSLITFDPFSRSKPENICEINVRNPGEMKSDLERSIKASFIAKERDYDTKQIKQQLVAQFEPACRRYLHLQRAKSIGNSKKSCGGVNTVDQRDLFSQPRCDRKRGRGAAQMNCSDGEG